MFCVVASWSAYLSTRLLAYQAAPPRATITAAAVATMTQPALFAPPELPPAPVAGRATDRAVAVGWGTDAVGVGAGSCDAAGG